MARFYLPKLRGQCPDHMLEPGFFLDHYQIFRNFWLAMQYADTTIVFLMQRANTGLWEQLAPILDEVQPQLRERVRTVAIEDVLTALAATRVPDWVSGYGALLQEKYLLSVHK